MAIAQLPFSVSAVAHNGEAVVKVRGEIDLRTVPELSAAIHDGLRLRPATLAIDLSDVPFMDSAGCHCLLRAQRAAKNAAVQLELRGVTGPNLLVLQILDLDKTFTIRPS
jgi:anti-sigma B factor antagonist